MYRVNALLGKKIVHDATGEEVGQIGGVVFDEPRQRVLALLVDHGLLSKRRVLRWPSVDGISDVVVTCAPVPLPAAQDAAEVAKLAWQETPVTDMLVISAAGERIGTVSDMFIDRNGTLTDMKLSRAG
jgi:sporulation protein YlmC with PRC-barrel domain